MTVLKFETRKDRKARRWREVGFGAAIMVAVFVAGTAAWRFILKPEAPTDQPQALAFTSQGEELVDTSTAQATSPSMPVCGSGSRYNCVVDGDTIWLNGVKIRVADIDTPEVSEPRCQSEYDLGMRATRRLSELLSEGPIEARPIGNRDEDQYGRKLRVLVRGGQSLGNVLVAEGLARTWTGRREPWC